MGREMGQGQKADGLTEDDLGLVFLSADRREKRELPNAHNAQREVRALKLRKAMAKHVPYAP